MTRRILVALACLAFLAACGGRSEGNQAAAEAARIVDPITVPAYVGAALADPERAMHQPTDARRHPAELIAFSGLKAGDRVLDLIPGDGYWSRIFSRIVGPEGRVYAVWPQAYADVAQGNLRTLQASRSISSGPARITTIIRTPSWAISIRPCSTGRCSRC
jgi:predicted methyltransferase